MHRLPHIYHPCLPASRQSWDAHFSRVAAGVAPGAAYVSPPQLRPPVAGRTAPAASLVTRPAPGALSGAAVSPEEIQDHLSVTGLIRSYQVRREAERDGEADGEAGRRTEEQEDGTGPGTGETRGVGETGRARGVQEDGRHRRIGRHKETGRQTERTGGRETDKGTGRQRAEGMREDTERQLRAALSQCALS